MGPFSGSDLEGYIFRDEVIPQLESCSDKQYPEVTWDQYGIVPTNEVAVVGRCGSAVYFAKAPSYLLVPGMADRIFGTDVADQQLGHELADRLWERHGAELIVQAMRRRERPGT
jgi:hypothetical protein